MLKEPIQPSEFKLIQNFVDSKVNDGINFGTESIRTQVNSYLSQFVLILVNSYSVFGQFVLIL